VQRPTRAKLEADIREALLKRGVPARADVIDGPPMFDAFHERCIARVVDDMDRMWAFFEESSLIVEPLSDTALGASLVQCAACGVTLDRRFDLSDVEPDPYVDLGGES